MKKFLATALLLTACVSTFAHAGFISGTQVTDGGKTINLQGLEWMPLTYTAGLSRLQVESSGGFTDRFGGVWNAGDWRYATRTETEALIGSLWGGRYDGWSTDNYDGAAAFLSLFGALDTPSNFPYKFSGFIFGEKRACSESDDMFCFGDVRTLTMSNGGWYGAKDKNNNWNDVTVHVTNTVNVGLFYEQAGASMGRTTDNYTYSNDLSVKSFGSLLVRTVNAPAAVSTPNAFGLFALGLGGLLLNRRRKTN